MSCNGSARIDSTNYAEDSMATVQIRRCRYDDIPEFSEFERFLQCHFQPLFRSLGRFGRKFRAESIRLVKLAKTIDGAVELKQGLGQYDVVLV